MFCGVYEDVKRTVTTVHALSVVLAPNCSRQALAANGSATPQMLFAAHMMPYARPFLRMNHWSRYKVDGLKISPLPIAATTPCVTIKCHTVTEKDEANDPPTLSRRPTEAQCF